MDTQRNVDTIKAPPNLLYLLHRRQVICNAIDIEFESVLVRFTTTPTDFQDRIPGKTFILLDRLRFDTSMFCPDRPIMSPNDGSTSWTDSCFGRSETQRSEECTCFV